jgi:hypothetical protein
MTAVAPVLAGGLTRAFSPGLPADPELARRPVA